MKPESSSLENVNTEVLSNQLKNNKNLNSFKEQYRRQMNVKFDSTYKYKSFILGICAAIAVFLFILTILCASRRDACDTKSIHSSSQSSTVLLNDIVVVGLCEQS